MNKLLGLENPNSIVLKRKFLASNGYIIFPPLFKTNPTIIVFALNRSFSPTSRTIMASCLQKTIFYFVPERGN